MRHAKTVIEHATLQAQHGYRGHHGEILNELAKLYRHAFNMLSRTDAERSATNGGVTLLLNPPEEGHRGQKMDDGADRSHRITSNKCRFPPQAIHHRSCSYETCIDPDRRRPYIREAASQLVRCSRQC